MNMEVNVDECLRELIRRHISINSYSIVGADPTLTSRLKRRCYEILLSHRGSEIENWWGNCFDQLHSYLYYNKQKVKNAERLNYLIDILWKFDCSDIRNALVLILKLSNCLEKDERIYCDDETLLTSTLPKKTFNCFELPFLQKELLESKKEKCCPAVFNINQLSSNLNKLEIPELSDDFGDQKYRLPRLSLKIQLPQLKNKPSSYESSGKIEIDEGFEETITPSSGISLTQSTLDDLNLWDIVSNDNAGVYKKHPKTWENFKCLDPALEKPLLSEAGSVVVDHVVQCHLSDLYVLSAEDVNRFRRSSFTIEANFAVNCLLYVLIGIPSTVFVFNKSSNRFEIQAACITGFSPTALNNLFQSFVDCGNCHRHLEQVVAVVSSFKQSGFVLRALSEGVERYLNHVRAAVTSLHHRRRHYYNNRFLQLSDDTAALRLLTRQVAQLLNVAQDFHLDRLPTGFQLLQRIYKAVVDSLFHPVFVSLFRCALQPYLIFLHDWAFEGRRWDQHVEFPLRPNPDLFCNVENDRWWNDGYTLEKMDDPILGSQLLHQIFVCGKTLLLLRQSCPLHPLFSVTRLRPRFFLGLDETTVRNVELKWKDYFAQVESQLLDSSRTQDESSSRSEAASVMSLAGESKSEVESVEITETNSEEEATYKAVPYQSNWPHLAKTLLVDIGERVLAKNTDPCSRTEFNDLVLPAVIERCVVEPLKTQVCLVNRVAVEYMLHEVHLKKYFHCFSSHFFMQDGEFAQSLCDQLFAQLVSIERPTQFLDSVILNSILDEACAQSGGGGGKDPFLSEFRSKLSFFVRYVPNSFPKHSLMPLECVRLTYPVEWPVSIVIGEESYKHYQFIFNFLLQLRLCLWSLTDIYHIFKMSKCCDFDPKTRLRYRQVQFYRQDMLHFIKSVHQHLNLMAFQRSFRKFQEDLERCRCIDELIATHDAYLKKTAFRCLLTKAASPLTKILKDVFTSILEFRWWLLGGELKLSESSLDRWNDAETFAHLSKAYQDYKRHSSLLAKDAPRILIWCRVLLLNNDYAHAAWLDKCNSRNYDETRELPVTLCKLLDAVARL